MLSKPRLLTVLSALLISSAAYSGPADREGIVLTQPDGTSFLANIRGDEFTRIKTTADGCCIMQDPLGFWCYAWYDADGRKICSGTRIGEKASESTIERSRHIPYGTLSRNSALKRKMPAEPGGNIVRRINGDGRTTKSSSPLVKHAIVIPVQFKDIKMRYGKEDFDKLLTEKGYGLYGAEGSAKDYFDSQFNGIWEFDFKVCDIVTVSRKREYYGGNDSDDQDKAPEEMIREACILADSQVDFSQYDDDNDGEVDNIFVFFAGLDEAEGGEEECIWSHSWYLYSGAGITLTLDGKRINRYACTSELSYGKTQTTFKLASIGSFCHEFSHTLGLPDMYDTDYDKSGGTSDALWGVTSLMDRGNLNNDGNTPPSYNAIEREILSLCEPEDLPKGKVIMTPAKDGGRTYRIQSRTEGEYYLLECREASGWDKKIGGSGLLVYHIDRSMNASGYSETYGKDLTAWQRWYEYNEVNSRPDHQCADLIEANSSVRNVATIYFPTASNNSLTPSGRTPIKFWDGTISETVITNIVYENGKVTMNVSEGGISIPKAEEVSSEIFQDAAVISWKAGEDWDGPSYLSWAKSDSEKTEYKVMPYAEGEYAYLIEGLDPKTAYAVDIYFRNEELTGEKTSCNFTTKSLSGISLPSISLQGSARNDDGSFQHGCSLFLRVINATDAEGIRWYYDGEKITTGGDCRYHPQKSGTLKAEIFFKDGNKLSIIKKINIR